MTLLVVQHSWKLISSKYQPALGAQFAGIHAAQQENSKEEGCVAPVKEDYFLNLKKG
jgi:hypothetical protein